MQKTKTGELVPRLGVLHPAENLTMLETGEPVFSPIILLEYIKPTHNLG